MGGGSIGGSRAEENRLPAQIRFPPRLASRCPAPPRRLLQERRGAGAEPRARPASGPCGAEASSGLLLLPSEGPPHRPLRGNAAAGPDLGRLQPCQACSPRGRGARRALAGWGLCLGCPGPPPPRPALQAARPKLCSPSSFWLSRILFC